MNCLGYALRFWNKNKKYVLYYNSGHVINIPVGTQITGFFPIEEYGYRYFKGAFKGLLDSYEWKLLKLYFNSKNNT